MSTPRRARVLLAKVTVFTLTAFVAGEVMSFVNFFLSHLVISAYNDFPNLWISDHNVLRSVIGMGIMATLAGFDRAGAGTLLAPYGRFDSSSSGSSSSSRECCPRCATPGATPSRSTGLHRRASGSPRSRGANTLTAWWGAGDMALFVVVLLACAGYVLVKRDA